MSPETGRARTRWFAATIGLTLLVVFLSVVTGFAWLPIAQGDSPFERLWDAICSSAGLVRNRAATDMVDHPGYNTSTVVVSSSMLPRATAESIGRGGTLALQCTMCHGARGLSGADIPNLAGQYAPAIYKQLQDFKSGARINATMTPRVMNLSEEDMQDLAAYYSSLARLPPYHPIDTGPAPQIVMRGAPMRNIPPCATCHGTIGYKIGTEWLEGESAVYLHKQLTAFAAGSRHNDISGQMRNIARNMTPAEIERAAVYYANHYPDYR
jgi:cytochrome c553